MAVVKYKTNLHRPRLGVCSNWLASFTENDLRDTKIRLWVAKGSITLPKDPEIPIIMVGPGTLLFVPLFPYPLDIPLLCSVYVNFHCVLLHTISKEHCTDYIYGADYIYVSLNRHWSCAI